MSLLNLTPHAIVLRVTGQADTVLPPSGQIARVASVSQDTGLVVAGARVIRNVYGAVPGIPTDAEGVPLPCIVSGMVLAALPAGTLNVYAPATGATAIRENGQVVAVTELVAA